MGGNIAFQRRQPVRKCPDETICNERFGVCIRKTNYRSEQEDRVSNHFSEYRDRPMPSIYNFWVLKQDCLRRLIWDYEKPFQLLQWLYFSNWLGDDDFIMLGHPPHSPTFKFSKLTQVSFLFSVYG